MEGGLWTNLNEAVNNETDLTSLDVADLLGTTLGRLRAADARANPFGARFARDDGIELLRQVRHETGVDVLGVIWWIDQTSDPVMLRARLTSGGELHVESLSCGLHHQVSRDDVVKGWYESPDWADRNGWFFHFTP